MQTVLFSKTLKGNELRRLLQYFWSDKKLLGTDILRDGRHLEAQEFFYALLLITAKA